MESDDEDPASREEVSYLSIGAVMHKLTEPAVRSAIRALELPSGSRGLDAGCGIGNHTLWLAEEVSPNGHVTGVDISDECLARAEETSNRSELREQVSFRRGDIFNLPFEDDTFDWVWSADVLYLWHMMSKAPSERSLPVMQELKRVVRPGGTIAFAFWASAKLLPGYPLLEARLCATEAANWVGPYGITPELHSTRALGWFQEAGLKEPKVRSFLAEVQAPFTDDMRDALIGTFQMYWEKTKPELSEEDWKEYLRLCSPESSDFILNTPDYYAFVVYSLFQGRVDK